MNPRKAYVVGWKADPVEGGPTRYQVQFDPQPERAHAWETREDAAGFYHSTLDGVDIKISALGDKVCRNFRVEERAPSEFVVVCDYPA